MPVPFSISGEILRLEKVRKERNVGVAATRGDE